MADGSAKWIKANPSLITLAGNGHLP